MKIQFPLVGVVGAGAMGRGIAQMMVQAGSQVRLFDAQPGTANAACQGIAQQWQRMVDKNRLDAEQAAAFAGRLQAVDALTALAGCDLVVEAIVERLDAKQALLRELEGLLRPDAALATNTSSLSVTAIGAALQRPERFAGLHFFNPVPVMGLIEVIRGLATSDATVGIIEDYAERLGKAVVRLTANTSRFFFGSGGLGYDVRGERWRMDPVTGTVTIYYVSKGTAANPDQVPGGDPQAFRMVWVSVFVAMAALVGSEWLGRHAEREPLAQQGEAERLRVLARFLEVTVKAASAQAAAGDVSVNFSRADVGVTEEFLDHAQVGRGVGRAVGLGRPRLRFHRVHVDLAQTRGDGSEFGLQAGWQLRLGLLQSLRYLLAGEVFPTAIRGRGAGFAAAFAKLGAVLRG